VFSAEQALERVRAFFLSRDVVGWEIVVAVTVVVHGNFFGDGGLEGLLRVAR